MKYLSAVLILMLITTATAVTGTAHAIAINEAQMIILKQYCNQQKSVVQNWGVQLSQNPSATERIVAGEDAKAFKAVCSNIPFDEPAENVTAFDMGSTATIAGEKATKDTIKKK